MLIDDTGATSLAMPFRGDAHLAQATGSFDQISDF